MREVESAVSAVMEQGQPVELTRAALRCAGSSTRSPASTASPRRAAASSPSAGW